MTKKKMKCTYCGISYGMRLADYTSRVKDGGTRFFCSLSCSARYGNSLRENKRVPIEKICPHCEKGFETFTGAYSPAFCSRSCASAGSVTDYRRQQAKKTFKKNGKKGRLPKAISKSLRKREGWKYKELKIFLEESGIEAIFEYPVGNRIFDMALPEQKLLVEFDSPYHNEKKQIIRDRKKDATAMKKGWDVKRVPVPSSTVINPEVIGALF